MPSPSSRGPRGSGEASGTHLLHVEIAGIRPSIWRDVVVPSDMALSDLHGVLQTAFGWSGCHMHAFRVGRPFREVREFTHGRGVERPVLVKDIAPRKNAKFVYEYDFGDSWEHRITVREIVPEGRSGPARRARCVGGMRAPPPEDCGGTGGYAHLLRVLGDPKHSESAEFRESAGGFDAEAFSIDAVNRALGWK